MARVQRIKSKVGDEGHQLTERELRALERRIDQVYSQAAAEVKDTVETYFDYFAERVEREEKRLKNGEITKAQFERWETVQLARGQRYLNLQNELANRYTRANEVAVAYINDSTPSIYSLNRNYTAYTIESAGANVSFNLWDESTVARLIVENPSLMPNYPEAKAIRRGIDLAYGKEQITASVTSGILQGKSVYKIADDLQRRLKNMNRDSAIRTARTATTEAQNAGRQDCYEEAEAMGIEIEKEWMATNDARTREAHGNADGQTVKVDDPFIVGGEELMYPGDPDGSPENIYNCRCTTVANVRNVDMSDRNRMSYREWLKSHG